MDKRKEQKINLDIEKQVDFVKLVESLDWSKEIDPVMLVKAANKVAGLSGTKKFETNEKSYGLLVKSFERRVSKFTEIRFAGKDRFYKLKPECTAKQLIHYAKTGLEIDVKGVKEKEKDFGSFYVPEIPETEIKEAVKSRKRVFPDDEALAKTAIVLLKLKEGGGEVATSEIIKISESLGWKRQRSVNGKVSTLYQEANLICSSLLDMKNPVIINRMKVKFAGDLSVLSEKINDIQTLMESEELRLIIQSMIPKKEEKTEKQKDPKEELEVEKLLEELKDLGVSEEEAAKDKKTEDEKQKVIVSSPIVGKSVFAKKEEAKPIPFENIKTRWNKSLIAEAIYQNPASIRGTYFSYVSISQTIKRVRFVDIQPLEIKNLIQEVANQKQLRGIFRGQDSRGFVIGSESLLKDFFAQYDQRGITEQIYIRLKMTLKEIQESYPGIKIEIASEITENDNIYVITANRTEECERMLAKLIFCMRSGEIVLESKNNWTLKRVDIIMEKLGLLDIC